MKKSALHINAALCILMLVSIPCAGPLWGYQDTPGGNPASPPKAEKARPAVQKAQKKLLRIDNGNFRYERIPGITSEEKETEDIREEKKPETESKKEISGEEKGDGLFGLSKEMTDTLVKSFLVLLIFFIFVLYKMRSRKSRRKLYK